LIKGREKRAYFIDVQFLAILLHRLVSPHGGDVIERGNGLGGFLEQIAGALEGGDELLALALAHKQLLAGIIIVA
jgi:hypothetical protein